MLEHKEHTSVSVFEECSRLLRPHKLVEGMREDKDKCEHALRIRDTLKVRKCFVYTPGGVLTKTHVIKTKTRASPVPPAKGPRDAILLSLCSYHLVSKQVHACPSFHNFYYRYTMMASFPKGVAEHAGFASVGSLAVDVLETLQLGKSCGVALDSEETMLVAATVNRLAQKQAFCKVR